MAHDTSALTGCDISRTHGLEFDFLSRPSAVAETKVLSKSCFAAEPMKLLLRKTDGVVPADVMRHAIALLLGKE